ncbi:MAG: protease complex subunit PrcB family protein [Phycisphaeraceae bacterium]
MRTRIWKTLAMAALVGAVGLTGCQSGSSDDEPEAKKTFLAEPVAIVEKVDGDSPALKTISWTHVQTQGEYADLGDPNIFPGEIDFDTYDLVVVALGEQPTGGYAITIESLQLTGGELAISGKVTTPAPDAAVTQALTYPYSAALIANTQASSVVPYIED